MHIKTIGETSLYINDGNYSSKYPRADEFLDKGVPFLSAYNIREGRVVWDKMKYISAEHHQRLKKGHIKEGDVLLITRGSIGSVAYVTSEFDDVNINAQLVFLRANGFDIDSRYLFYALSTDEFYQHVQNRSSGTAQPQLPIHQLVSIPIRLHDIETQRKIAAVLSTYDDLIEVNTRRIRVLEEMAQAVYREWFGSVDAGSLPEGWEEKELGDVAEEVRRSVNPNELDPKTPYLGLEHFPRKSFALSDWGYAGDIQSSKLAFKKGEILFGKIRPYFHKVGVAPLDGICSTDTIVIMPKAAEYFGLVLSCVFSEDFVNHATLTSQGTKMPRTNWKVLIKYPVLIPPNSVLEQFNRTINDFVDMIQNLLFSNRNLRRTRDLLLPRLVSGEVDVSELDIEGGKQ